MPENLLSSLKFTADSLVKAKIGISSRHLFTELSAQYPESSSELIQRAIHEMVQERQLVRIEYQVPEYGSTIFAFYLPANSRTL